MTDNAPRPRYPSQRRLPLRHWRRDTLEFQERNHYAKDRAVEGRREEIPLGTKLRLENKEREYETTME